MTQATDAVRAQAEGPPGRWWRAAAWLWLCCVLAVGWHQVQFWQQGRIDTDVMALLPHNEQAPEIDIATQNLVGGLSRQILVMLGSSDWQAVQQASSWAHQQLQSAPLGLQVQSMGDTAAMQSALDFYRPWRDRLLTPAQSVQLAQHSDTQLAQQALAALYQPAGQMRLLPWREDPLGLWTQWWTGRAAQSEVRPRDGLLWVQAQGAHWSVLSYQVPGAAFGFSEDAPLAQTLDALQAQLQARWPGMQLLRAGVPLHAEAAAAQAHGEVNTIGWGSLAGVLLLAWLAFRSLRPIALVGMSLLLGTAVALSVTAWWFGQVHILTLVFGASLVGVAEDYGIHYFAARQGHAQVPPFRLMRSLMPSLWLALGTSVIAYLALGAAAFPGLRQMALFSVVGLTAALLTVVCWFPWLDRSRITRSRFADALGASLLHWPRLPLSARACAVYATLLVGVLALIASRLHVQDDVRQLQNSPADLVAQQKQIGQMLGLPSPTQFYVVQGPSEQAVLEREEQLAAQLQVLVAQGAIAGWSAVSDWVPSEARQQANAQLLASREAGVLAQINAVTGEDMQRPEFAQASLNMAAWLAHPLSAAARNLWVGPVGERWMSVVMLRGVNDRAVLPKLQALEQPAQGLHWVDKPQEISQVLQRYRSSMTWLLALGHLLVLGVLWAYFGRQAWRAWLPTVIASVAVVAVMALLGQPWQLFSVLGLVLLLGVGVDYGIFLLEHEADATAWLAVLIGAGSTWLAFGLLALSQTPALKAFGSTLMVGLPVVLCLAPCFRARSAAKPPG